MSIFTTKSFARWARKQRLSDGALCTAEDELRRGLVDADLGGHLFKKRVPLPGRGKSGGARTIVAFQAGHHTFYLYGFAKNERDNIDDDELDAFQKLAQVLQGYSPKELTDALEAGELKELEPPEEDEPEDPDNA